MTPGPYQIGFPHLHKGSGKYRVALWAHPEGETKGDRAIVAHVYGRSVDEAESNSLAIVSLLNDGYDSLRGLLLLLGDSFVEQDSDTESRPSHEVLQGARLLLKKLEIFRDWENKER